MDITSSNPVNNKKIHTGGFGTPTKDYLGRQLKEREHADYIQALPHWKAKHVFGHEKNGSIFLNKDEQLAMKLLRETFQRGNSYTECNANQSRTINECEFTYIVGKYYGKDCFRVKLILQDNLMHKVISCYPC